MNWKLSLLKIIPLLTLTTGLLVPINIAEAASSPSKKTETIDNGSYSEAQKQPVTVSQILLSKKAQKIEFFSLLAIISGSLFAPELLRKSTRKSQKGRTQDNSESLNYSTQENLQQQEENQSEVDISYLEGILKDTKKIDFVSTNLVKLEDHKKSGLKNHHNDNQKIS